MAAIQFIQYLMPDGRPSPVTIDRPEHIAEKAKAITAKGFQFECEMLSDFRTISLTITHPKDGDVEIEVVSNGPDVPLAIDKMIDRFSSRIAA